MAALLLLFRSHGPAAPASPPFLAPLLVLLPQLLRKPFELHLPIDWPLLALAAAAAAVDPFSVVLRIALADKDISTSSEEGDPGDDEPFFVACPLCGWGGGEVVALG